jgi:AraC-like DNA-binding protein
MLPAWDSGDYVSVSNPSSIAVSFTYQRRATVEVGGSRRVDRTIPAGSFGTAGAAPIAWLRVREPSECLEVTASRALRRSIAEELLVPRHCDLDDLHGGSDPVVWSIAARLRSIVRGAAAVDALQAETLVRGLYRRLLILRCGGREPGRGSGALSAARLAAVVEWIDAHLAQAITIADLARVASLSSSHFIRSFGRTMGVSPHRYVRAQRLQRAREQLARGATVSSTALAVGFTSVSQFRTAFYSAFGHLPSSTPRRGARLWIGPTRNHTEGEHHESKHST